MDTGRLIGVNIGMQHAILWGVETQVIHAGVIVRCRVDVMMALLEGSRGVGDDTTQIRILLFEWAVIRIWGLVTGTTTEKATG